MKLAIVLSCSLAALALHVAQSQADPVPKHATGIWSIGKDCQGSSPMAMVNSQTAILVETTNDMQTVAIAKAEFVAGSHVLSLEGDVEELFLPPLEHLRECRSLPGSLPVTFAEALSVFPKLDEIDEACLKGSGIGPRCAAVGFGLIDITGDGRLSRAEISRAIRAAAFFVGYSVSAAENQTPFVPFKDLLLSWLAGSVAGPVIAGNLIGSYDYDGDGFLTLPELMQDRAPEGGLEGALASLAEELEPNSLSAVLRFATGVLEVLP